MTREHAAQLLPLIQAYAEGKTIQGEQSTGRWVDLDEPSFQPVTQYRIKPTPRTVPWDCPEDVPPVCWLRSINGNFGHYLVTFVDYGGVFAGQAKDVFLFGSKFATLEYSTDRKTWHPCTKQIHE